MQWYDTKSSVTQTADARRTRAGKKFLILLELFQRGGAGKLWMQRCSNAILQYSALSHLKIV